MEITDAIMFAMIAMCCVILWLLKENRDLRDKNSMHYRQILSLYSIVSYIPGGNEAAQKVLDLMKGEDGNDK